MKNLIILISLLALGCGNKDGDPTPAAETPIAKMKAALLGTWEMQTIVVRKTNGESATFTGGCDESSYALWVQENVADVDFRFQSQIVQVGGQEDGLEGYKILNCQGGDVKVKYTVMQIGSKFAVRCYNWPNGWDDFQFEINSTLDNVLIGNMEGKQINVLPAMTKHNIESITWTFKKK